MKVKVKNRSGGKVIYKVMLDNGLEIRRELVPGEVREIESDEIIRLTYKPGGRKLILNYLLIEDEALLRQIISNVQPEYWLDDENIKNLLMTGSLNQFLDCLDFGPDGVIDLIKKYAVQLPLNDVQKRDALMRKTGFNVDAAIKAIQAEKDEARKMAEEEAARKNGENNDNEALTVERRTPVIEAPATQRRTSPNYKVVTPKE